MSQPTGQSGNTNAADTRQDPAMKALYHMSKTAGVGLGDYAEVNVLSVIGLLTGIACFLLLIFDDSYILLVIPAAALIACVIAILQIRNSNGTQTGTIWALLGMVLALAFGGVNLFRHAMIACDHAQSEGEIAQLITKLSSSATTQSSVPAAYELFHPRFRENVNPETFARTVALRTGLAADSPMKELKLGGNVIFDTDPETKVTQATALVVMYGHQTDETGKPFSLEFPALFRRDPAGVWTIYTIPDWFGEERRPGR